MSRRVDRAFNQACSSSLYDSQPSLKDQAAPPPDVVDDIKRILSAWEKKDYFGLLQLPAPTVDDLGEEGREYLAVSCPHVGVLHAFPSWP